MSGTHDPNQNPQRTILYIEHNPANFLLVENLVAIRSNFKLLRADNGHQGVQMACSHVPDLILMEINLPDINGMEALKILRESPETAHIPVIAVSSNAYEKQIEEALKAGCNRYLTKPYKINDLMNAIDVGLNDTK
jgi:CheY-like chemotaxis protein